jgi:hypothetical protein
MSMRFVSLLLVLCAFAVPAWGQPASTLTLLDEGGQEGSDFAVGERLTLRLEAAELNTLSLDVATVLVTASDGDQEEVALAETAPDSGVFQGWLPLIPSLLSMGDGALQAAAGATITATHADLGGATQSMDTAVIAPHAIRFLDRRGAVTEKILEGYKVFLRVYDWDANTDSVFNDSVTATVTAQGTTDQETVMLYETGADSGVFEGWVYTEVTDGSHSADDGPLETFAAYPDQHDTLTATYAPAATAPSTATAPTVGGILRVLDEWGNEATVFSPGQRIYFQVEQVRRWSTPIYGLRVTYLNIRSTTTLDFESIPLIETGIESWVFEGSIPISTATPDFEGVLQAAADGEGLEISVIHPSDKTNETVTVTNSLASVRFLDQDGRPATRLFENQTATVRVQDTNPVSSVLATLESLLGGDIQSLLLSPVPARPGAYEAPFLVRFGSPVATPRLLVSRQTGDLDGADTVTASYSAASSTARTLASSLTFLDEDGTETETLPITAPLRIRVRDHSAISPTAVTVTSWATGDSEELSLAEIEPGSGIFEGEIPTGFGNPDPDDRLQTRIGDVVTVVHGWDPDPAFHAIAAVRMTEAALDFVDAEGKATDVYLRNNRVYLRLRDSRYNGNPSQVDTAGVVLRSLDFSGQRLDQETVFLTETAPDSSLFTGSIRMEGDYPYDHGNGVLQTSYNQYPYAEYDTLVAEGADRVDQARTEDSILRITDAQGNDLSSVIFGQTLYVRLERPLYNTSPGAVDIAFGVRLKSIYTGDVERINLYETGINTGVFTGSISTYQGGQSSLTGSLSGQPGDYIEVWSEESWPLSADAAWFVASSGNAPTPVNDAVTAVEDGSVTIDVLANDTDPNGDPLTITAVSGATNGTAVLNPNSTVTFTPTPNTNNTGSFSYQVSDGGAVASALVTITITPVNDPPNANNDTFTVNEDTTATLNVRFNDSDPDPNSTLTITHVTNPTQGTATTDGSTITYTPPLNYSGSASFTYTLSDGVATDTATVSITVFAINDPPTTVADFITLNEDSFISFTPTLNDTDPEGHIITLLSYTNPPAGAGNFSRSSNTLTYIPPANYNGSFTTTYVARDINGASSSGTITITVNPLPDSPDAVNDSVTTLEDTPVTISVLANDTDADGNTLTITTTTQGTKGAVAINGTTVLYTPNLNATGSDSFTYTINDGTGRTDTATVSVTLTAVNDAPNAVDDAATTNENVAIAITVLANDTDAENQTLTVTLATPPANGIAAVGADKKITYTPNFSFFGTDSFTYTVSDGTGTDTATVTITVVNVNDPPHAADDALTIAEDTPGTVAVLANDSDNEGQPLTVTSYLPTTHGFVAINPDSTITYTPKPNFSGEDFIVYTVSDGQATNTALVLVIVTPVNDAPVAVDDSAATNEDTAVTITVRANDTDVEGSTLTITEVTPGAKGTAVINANGTLTYTPSADENGTDSFDYTLSDGNGGAGTATVTVTIYAVPDAPVAVDDTATTSEDTPVTINVVANDTDGDGDTLTAPNASIMGNPPGPLATLTINGDGTITYTPVANFSGTDTFRYTVSDSTGRWDFGEVTVTITAVNDAPDAVNDSASTNEDAAVTIAVRANDTDVENDAFSVTAVTQGANGNVAINPDGTVTYTPNANFNGADAFTYTVSDGTGGSDTATVSVTVHPVNDAPDAVDDTASTDEDTAVTISVLVNDVDVDGDTLTILGIGQGANGSVAVSGSNLIYTPNANFQGTDSFTYMADDDKDGFDTATVTVTVNAVNDAPDAVNDSASTSEDTAVTVSVLGNDTDLDGDSLSISAVTQGTNGGVTISGANVIYTPNANFNGADSFTYIVSDGNGGSDTATVSLTITAANDAPDAVNDAASTNEDVAVTVSVLGNDSDLDGDSIAISAVTQGANGAVTISGSNVIYTPNANFNGADSFNYTISDGNGGSDTATVSVTINATNDAPDAVNDAASTNEDVAVTVSVLANDADLDGDSLSISAVTQGSNGTVTISGSNVVYTPNANFNGTDSFTYTVSDGQGGTATASVSVSVSAVNDPPTVVNDAAATNEDTAVIVTVIANDSDVDGDTLQVTAVTQGTQGSIAINANDTVTYTPAPNTFGVDSFTYTVRDAANVTRTATVTVSVASLNDAPAAAADSANTREGASVVIPVLANDSDLEGNPLTVTGTSTPANGMAAVNGDGTVTYTADANFNGTDSFTYTLSDGQGGTANDTVTVTVKDAFERVAVLGTHGVWVQTGADVLSGDVVVNQSGAAPFLTGSVELSLAGSITTPAGWDVQGNRVDVASGATVASDLFYNQKTGTGSVTGAQTTPLPLPVFAALPAFQTATPGATDVNVGNNGVRTLAAGSYRDLIVGRRGTVTFTGGTYNFRTIRIDREAKIYFSAAASIRVQQKLSTLQTTVLQPAAGATLDASSVVIYVAGLNGTGGGLTETPKVVEFGNDNVVWANIYAPDGTIWVKDRTQVRGSLVGKDVQVGPDAQVTLDSYYVGQ